MGDKNYQSSNQESFGDHNNHQPSSEYPLIYDVKLKRYIPYKLYSNIEKTIKETQVGCDKIKKFLDEYEDFLQNNEPFPTTDTIANRNRIIEETKRLKEKHYKWMFGSDDEDETQ
uniref:Uncharacterized protein n=1 Tax=Parastrongyloides trichosuri TaxID=131310 RepID=A0A0N4Z8N1_PARTI